MTIHSSELGDLPQGRLCPRHEAFLRAGVAAWVNDGRTGTNAAERLRLVRAALRSPVRRPSESGPVMAWTGRHSAGFFDRPVRRGLVALVALTALAGMASFFSQSSAKISPDAKTAQTGGYPLGTVEGAPEAVEVRIEAETKGLFLRFAAQDGSVWKPVRVGQRCPPRTLLQAALNAQPVSLMAFQRHRLRLAPGTLICLGADPTRPVVDLWRGRVEIWAGEGPLTIGTLSRKAQGAVGGFQRRDLATLVAGERATLETAMLAIRTRSLGEYALLDERDLQAVACRVIRGKAEAPMRQVEEGTANLLNVIEGDFESVTVSKITEALQDGLRIHLRLSPRALRKAGEKVVTLRLGQVSGGEALAALAQEAGLTIRIEEGEVILEVEGERLEKTAPPEREEF